MNSNTSISATDKTLIALHIEKTAGRTFRQVLNKQFSADDIFATYGRPVPDAIAELASMPEDQRSRIRLLVGHVSFGVDKHFPQECVYLTMLREPVDRVISHYYYHLERADTALYEVIHSKGLSLEEYVSSGVSSELNDGQVRVLCGDQEVDSVYGHGPISKSHLEAAKRNLTTRFATFGLTERFDESALLFGRVMNWENVYYNRDMHVTSDRPARSEIPQKTLQVIEQYHTLDIELYEFAKQLFDESLREHGIGRDRLATYQRNQRYNRMANRLQGIPVMGGLVRLAKSGVRRLVA